MERITSKFDLTLFTTIFVMLILGILMVYSASSFKAKVLFDDSHYVLKQHGLRVLAGLVLMLIVAKINYRFWLRLSPALLLVAIGLLFYLLLAPDTLVIRGSKRWLVLGSLQFQPADLARLCLILFLAYSLGKPFTNDLQDQKRFYFHLVVIAAIVIPIFLQPDVGSATLIATIAMVILFLAGAKLRHLATIAVVTLPALALFVLQQGYQKVRVTKFLASIRGEELAWQTRQSLIALGNGSIAGLGFGGSKQKYHFLPDPFTDFIFAIVGEEIGLIGTVAVTLLFAFLLWRGFKVASRVENPAGKLLGYGIVFSIGLYAFVNIGVVINLLPTTGIPMPFLSYGGSALLTNLFAAGILLNLAQEGSKEHRMSARSTDRMIYHRHASR